MNASPFQYEPLRGTGYLRLVHLIEDGDARHGFQICLCESHLIGGAPFCALSYTWGLPFHTDILELDKLNVEQGETFTIDCDDGQEIAITENLFYAMKQVIRNAQGGPLMPLWIDALSIDQKNEAEKSSQIGMMGEIYSEASQTMVWLGKDDPTPRFLWVHANRELETYLTDVAEGRRDRVPTGDILAELGMTSIQDWQATMWDYVSFYRQRRYFRRVWIIQETALARELTVLCGSHILDWTRLVVMANLLSASNVIRDWSMLGQRMDDLLTANDSWVPGKEIRALHMFRTDHRLNGGLPMNLHRTKANFMRGRQDDQAENAPFEAILRALGALGDEHHKEYAYLAWTLQQFRGYQATDKRDYVFAALAFCSPFFRRARLELPIKPSYHMTVKEVYIEVTAKLLGTLPVLSLLSMANDQGTEVQGLPSWVPDFGGGSVSRPLIQRGFTPSLNDFTKLEPIYNASKVVWPSRDQRPLAIVADGSRLQVWGTCVGSVQDICPATYTSPSRFSYVPYLEFIAAALPADYPHTLEHREEALWRTLFGNHNVSEMCYPASDSVGCEYFRQHVLETIAASMISNTYSDGEVSSHMADSMRVSMLLMTLALDGNGWKFLPHPFEVVIHTFTQVHLIEQVVAQHRGTAATSENVLRLAGEAASRLGSSRAEFECIGMFSQGMELPNKRLYTTDRGFLGLGPSTMQSGDEVWVIQGAKVPFLLRRRHLEGSSAHEFTLLGETYLHGIMDGQIFDENTTADIVEITLC